MCNLMLDKACRTLYIKSMDNLQTIEDFSKRLLPLTYFRRNAGKVMAKLPKAGTFILTKDGKPVAKLSTIRENVYGGDIEENIKKLKKLAGGFRLGKGLAPSKINKIIDESYAKNLLRQQCSGLL